MKIDLHIHSSMSDGTDSPCEIVTKAVSLGMTTIALTDHDTIAGLDELRECAKSTNLQVIDGIELSTFANCEVHILGYNFDRDSDILNQSIADFADQRRKRIKKIIDRLATFNVHVDWDKIKDENSIGRMHVAQELIKSGYVAGVNEAFERYLGSRGVAYIPSKRITPLEGVRLIRQAKGQAFIAHPLRFFQDRKLEDYLAGLQPYGLTGLEAFYPTHDEKTVKALLQLASKYRMAVSGGTDYHGKNKYIELGSIAVDLPTHSKKILCIK